MKNKGITSTNILIIVAVIVGLSLIGGLGYMAYQNWFGETKLAAQYYTSQQDCKDAGYYWYNDSCHSKQKKSKKDEDKDEDRNKNREAEQIADCGVTERPEAKKAVEKEVGFFEKDETLVCLGKHILNNCSDAKALIKTPSEGPLIFRVKGENEENCKIRLKYGDAKDIPTKDRKQYANKYISCPISFLKELGNFQVTKEMPSPEDKPGSYAASLYFMMGWATVGYSGESRLPEEEGCTGTLVDYLQKKAKAEKEKKEKEKEKEMARQTKGFACKNVEQVNFSEDLSDETFILTWGDPFSGNGYGRYGGRYKEAESWRDYSGKDTDYYKNNDLKTVGINPPDDLSKGGIREKYPAGVLTIECESGKSIDAYLPGFTDVSGEGYKTNGGEEFTNGLYIGKDGSTYFDIELTELARSSSGK